MVPGETPVFQMLDERGLDVGYLYGSSVLCHPLYHIDSWDKPGLGLSPNFFKSLFIIFQIN